MLTATNSGGHEVNDGNYLPKQGAIGLLNHVPKKSHIRIVSRESVCAIVQIVYLA